MGEKLGVRERAQGEGHRTARRRRAIPRRTKMVMSVSESDAVSANCTHSHTRTEYIHKAKQDSASMDACFPGDRWPTTRSDLMVGKTLTVFVSFFLYGNGDSRDSGISIEKMETRNLGHQKRYNMFGYMSITVANGKQVNNQRSIPKV